MKNTDRYFFKADEEHKEEYEEEEEDAKIMPTTTKINLATN